MSTKPAAYWKPTDGLPESPPPTNREVGKALLLAIPFVAVAATVAIGLWKVVAWIW